MPLIHVGLIKDDDLNAYAGVRGSDAFIAINRGTLLLLYDVFLRALSLPNVFPQIGSPAPESVRNYHYRGLVADYARVRELRGEPRSVM